MRSRLKLKLIFIAMQITIRVTQILWRMSCCTVAMIIIPIVILLIIKQNLDEMIKRNNALNIIQFTNCNPLRKHSDKSSSKYQTILYLMVKNDLNMEKLKEYTMLCWMWWVMVAWTEVTLASVFPYQRSWFFNVPVTCLLHVSSWFENYLTKKQIKYTSGFEPIMSSVDVRNSTEVNWWCNIYIKVTFQSFCKPV